jgi:aspartyl-tRNA(Asn)/glutamyl-tRNA(Gln) amidotransferase subunit A
MTSALHRATAGELAERVRDGSLRAADVLDACLHRIRAHDGSIGAFVEVDAHRAHDTAKRVDRARRAGASLGPLAGVPVAVKDVYCRTGHLTTCASRMLAGFRAPYTATAVERLERAGAVLVGRTNMDEFAMGSSTEHSTYGPTRNPFDRTRTPGGSSGGSAAAVAARMVPVALGSDTGGSVRQPAALCGVAGLKPTYGRISRHGLVAFASSLDHVAPFARTAEDLALLLAVMAGPDPRDSTSSTAPAVDWVAASRARDLAGLTVGVPSDYFSLGLAASVEAAVRGAIEVLRELGARIVSIDLPHTRYAIPTYYLICAAEASSNLARYDGVRYGFRIPGEHDLDGMYRKTRAAGFGAEVKRRILLGTFCLCSGYYDAFYLQASRVRTLLRTDFDRAFSRCDVLAAPTTPTTAFRLGENLADPLVMYLNDVLTAPANLAGVPALSVPCGADQAGLPIGLQLLGPMLGEDRVLRVAGAYQRATNHHLQEPVL